MKATKSIKTTLSHSCSLVPDNSIPKKSSTSSSWSLILSFIAPIWSMLASDLTNLSLLKLTLNSVKIHNSRFKSLKYQLSTQITALSVSMMLEGFWMKKLRNTHLLLWIKYLRRWKNFWTAYSLNKVISPIFKDFFYFIQSTFKNIKPLNMSFSKKIELIPKLLILSDWSLVRS